MYKKYNFKYRKLGLLCTYGVTLYERGSLKQNIFLVNDYEGGHSNNFNCECNWLDYKYDKVFLKKRHYMKNEKKNKNLPNFPKINLCQTSQPTPYIDIFVNAELYVFC